MKSLIKYSCILALGTLAIVDLSSCGSGSSSSSSSNNLPVPSNNISFGTTSVNVSTLNTLVPEVVLPGTTTIGVARYGFGVLAGVDNITFELQDSSGAVVSPTIATVVPTTCALSALTPTCSIAITANIAESEAVQYQLVSTVTPVGDPLPPQAPASLPVTISPAIEPIPNVPGTLSITPSVLSVINPVYIRNVVPTTIMVSLSNSQDVIIAAPITVTASGALAGTNVVTNTCLGLTTLLNVCTVTINPELLDDNTSGQGIITVSSPDYQSVTATVNVVQH